MRLSIGADEKLLIVDHALKSLQEKGHELTWYGPDAGEVIPWPKIAQRVSEDIIEGKSEEGILFCWTGTGVSIAANKIPGIRAALCFDSETARGARLWNNANVLCISMRLTTEIILEEILEKWFKTKFVPNDTDSACISMIENIEKKHKTTME